MAKKQGFGRAEKLKSRKAIDALFASGKSFAFFPLRVKYAFVPGAESGIKTGVTVSKKYFKRAVHRNRLKRLMREAYRLQKEELLGMGKAKSFSGNLFFIYTDKTLCTFEVMYAAMGQCLQQLQKVIAQQ